MYGGLAWSAGGSGIRLTVALRPWTAAGTASVAVVSPDRRKLAWKDRSGRPGIVDRTLRITVALEGKAAPALGEPGSVPREFRLFASPSDQSAGAGQAAEFFVSVRGYEGWSDPVTWSITQWSSQRFPEPKDASTLPLSVLLPDVTQPGLTATVHVETAGAEPGIYYLTLQASGGGQSKTVELALALS